MPRVLDEVAAMIDEYEGRTGVEPTRIVMSHALRRKVIRELQDDDPFRRPPLYAPPWGGQCILLYGIPLYVERDAALSVR